MAPADLLDATRLVEDNSPCCGRGHTETDINSWHEYLPGWRWQDRVQLISDSTFGGSPWNFEKGYAQAHQPMMNSEFGNVWGYNGSTGDVDWSWDYHLAVDAFRRHPAMAGWLYTEHHDVINEWNGYVRADRSEKETGLGEIVPGIVRSAHGPVQPRPQRGVIGHGHGWTGPIDGLAVGLERGDVHAVHRRAAHQPDRATGFGHAAAPFALVYPIRARGAMRVRS